MTEPRKDKITVAITGAGGQLGRHCFARFKYHFGYDVVEIDRVTFNESAALESALKGADVILHLAGVNRGTDDDVRDGNLSITDTLLRACNAVESKAHLICASTIQIDNDSVYGTVKREVGDKLAAHCAANGMTSTTLVLPNLFGELSKPYYNNFIGTFCDQITEKKPVTIHNDSSVTLMHYGEVAELIAEIIEAATAGEVRPVGTTSSVKTVADKLQAFYDSYTTSVIPDLRDPFDLRLFNSLRTRMFASHFPMSLVRHADARGSFFECVRALNPGQTSFSTTVPGIVRGDHFHFDKLERFIVLSGEALIRVRNIFNEEVMEFNVNGNDPCFIDMPPLHTHNIKNTGETELLTLFWSHDFFDPNRADTYSEAV